mmetsp:Transcript_13300/g.24739  ORF Transcript_13300/g.24739 Transcript_13300/m.24739 type:complete len:288 (-) Transcript_13300:44-907(-)
MICVAVQSLSGSQLLGPEFFPPTLSIAELRASVWARSFGERREEADGLWRDVRSYAMAPLEVKLCLGERELTDGETLQDALGQSGTLPVQITGLLASADPCDTDDEGVQYTPDVVGRSFVTKYHALLRQDPFLMHKFYKEESMCFATCHDATRVSGMGGEQIQDVLKSVRKSLLGEDLQYNDFDIQSRKLRNGAVEIVARGRPSQHRGAFVHTFILVPQTAPRPGFFVLRDVISCPAASPLASPAAWPQHAKARTGRKCRGQRRCGRPQDAGIKGLGRAMQQPQPVF